MRILIIGGTGSTIGEALIKHLLCEEEHLVVSTGLAVGNVIRTPSRIDLPLDIRNPQAVKEIVTAADAEHGPFDILVNNAGVLQDNFAAVMKESEWKDVLDVNLSGVYRTCKYMTRRMIPRKRGTIINIASFKGVVGCRGQINYSAAKAGVIALTRSMARELGVFNISVNAVCPGFIPSNLNGMDRNKEDRAREHSIMGIQHNLSDLVHFVGFLSSDKMKGVTGQVFHIDSRLH